MVTSSIEQTVQRRLTHAFISTDPVSITLIPRISTSTPTGGIAFVNGEPRNPQIFKLIEPGDSGYRSPTKTEQGLQNSFDYMLLGYWDAVIGENDVFIHRDKEYKVITVMNDNGFEQRALVMRHGW